MAILHNTAIYMVKKKQWILSLTLDIVSKVKSMFYTSWGFTFLRERLYYFSQWRCHLYSHHFHQYLACFFFFLISAFSTDLKWYFIVLSWISLRISNLQCIFIPGSHFHFFLYKLKQTQMQSIWCSYDESIYILHKIIHIISCILIKVLSYVLEEKKGIILPWNLFGNTK